MHGVCFRGGGREGEDGGLKCKTIAMRGLKVLLNIGGWWAKRLTFLIGSLIKCGKLDKSKVLKIEQSGRPSPRNSILIIETPPC